jgi:hypothetical protein
LVFTAIGIYYTPSFITKKEERKIAKIKADNAMFTAKVLEIFASDKKALPSVVAKNVAEELNQKSKNPYNEKLTAYVFETQCKGCNCVEYDDKLQMIILSAYNNKNEMIARTVIKPPAFVTYTKEKKK